MMMDAEFVLVKFCINSWGLTQLDWKQRSVLQHVFHCSFEASSGEGDTPLQTHAQVLESVLGRLETQTTDLFSF